MVRYFRAAVQEMLRKTAQSIRHVDDTEITRLVDLLIEAKSYNRNIFIIGAGRSGLVGRSFAMRLAQLNFNVYVVGETITPSIKKKDILFAVSGSGETRIVLTSAELAREAGAKVVAVTSFAKSQLSSLCDLCVVLHGRTRNIKNEPNFSREILGIHKPVAPLGTLFEIGSAIFLDSLVVEIMVRLDRTEPELMKRHATME